MSSKGFYTNGAEDISAASTRVNSIPLTDVDSDPNGSIGQLVSNATQQMSSLVRSEVELAKTELASSVKRGALGGGVLGVAGVIAAYSSFFFFFFLAELISIWLPRWSAYLIVFLFMLVLAGILALIGVKKFKGIKKPEKTIESVSELKHLVPGKATASLEASHSSGMFS